MIRKTEDKTKTHIFLKWFQTLMWYTTIYTGWTLVTSCVYYCYR